MALEAGTRLGVYEIAAPLGAGGMGEVYRARDTRLRRDVAIKVLPDAVAADPSRIARFQREAELLAALNHPNIAAVYGLEESIPSAGAAVTVAIVMELVDGETLWTRIARGALELDDALSIARQLADALEAAHDRGVVHRDLAVQSWIAGAINLAHAARPDAAEYVIGTDGGTGGQRHGGVGISL